MFSPFRNKTPWAPALLLWNILITLRLHLHKSFSYTKVMYIQHQKLGRKKISGRISSRPTSKKLTIDSQAFLTNILFNNIIGTNFLFVLLLSLVGWLGLHWGSFISIWGLTLSCWASQVAKWYRTRLAMQETQEMRVQSLGWEDP